MSGFFCVDKVVKLVSGGSVIIGPTPSSLERCTVWKQLSSSSVYNLTICWDQKDKSLSISPIGEFIERRYRKRQETIQQQEDGKALDIDSTASGVL